MPKVNIYLPDDLATAVREANVPVSTICQAALERAVRDVTAARSADTGPQDDRPAVGLFSRFTPKARSAVNQAQNTAHGEIGTEHVLLGVLDQPDNVATRALAALDIEPDDLRTELLASMEPPTDAPSPVLPVPFSRDARQMLEQTAKEAVGLGHNYIGCEHLLLGILATEDSLGSKVLRRMGVELRTTRRAVTTALAALLASQANPTPPAPPAVSPSTLDQILSRLDAIERRLPPEA